MFHRTNPLNVLCRTIPIWVSRPQDKSLNKVFLHVEHKCKTAGIVELCCAAQICIELGHWNLGHTNGVFLSPEIETLKGGKMPTMPFLDNLFKTSKYFHKSPPLLKGKILRGKEAVRSFLPNLRLRRRSFHLRATRRGARGRARADVGHLASSSNTLTVSLDPVLLFPTPKKDKKITHTFESNSECFRTSTSVMLGSWHSSPQAKKDKFVFPTSQTVEERGVGVWKISRCLKSGVEGVQS